MLPNALICVLANPAPKKARGTKEYSLCSVMPLGFKGREEVVVVPAPMQIGVYGGASTWWLAACTRSATFVFRCEPAKPGRRFVSLGLPGRRLCFLRAITACTRSELGAAVPLRVQRGPGRRLRFRLGPEASSGAVTRSIAPAWVRDHGNVCEQNKGD